MTAVVGRAASIGAEAYAIPEVRDQAANMLRDLLEQAVADRVVIEIVTHPWEERPIYEAEEIDGEWVEVLDPDGNYLQVGTEWRILIEAAVEDEA